jgi:hypothetical protein
MREPKRRIFNGSSMMIDITGNAMVVNIFWECNEHLKDEIPLEWAKRRW